MPGRPAGARGFLAAALREDFAQDDRLHEVRVPGLPETLWVVPGPEDAEPLVREGITRGRIWTATEVCDALDWGWAAQDFLGVAAARVIFDGEVVGTRRRPR